MENGLCLSGGGVKGAAHIGAIKALEEANIEFDYIGGTSSGSIVGCLYASGFTSDEIYKIFKEYCGKIKYFDCLHVIKLVLGAIFDRKIKVDGLNSGKNIEKLIKKICSKKDIYTIRDIKKSLVMPSVNLYNGNVICFTSCQDKYCNKNNAIENTIFINDIEIGKAVRASCSYPVVFSPCNYRNIKLIDGEIKVNVPWREMEYLEAKNIVNIIFEENVKKLYSKFNIICRNISKLYLLEMN